MEVNVSFQQASMAAIGQHILLSLRHESTEMICFTNGRENTISTASDNDRWLLNLPQLLLADLKLPQ
jgi:hypothetical protein